MIRLDLVEGFQWDDGNRKKSILKHEVTPSEVEQLFVNEPLLVLEDEKHSTREPRFHAYGRSHEGRLLQVSFTLRDAGRLIRVISARPMSRKERLHYGQEA